MRRQITASAAFLFLLATSAIPASTALFAADDSKPVEGTLVIGDRTYKLANAVAYETKSDDVTQITVLASDRRIPVDQIKAALKKGDGSDDRLSLSQPYLKITFSSAGEPTYSQGWADNSSFAGSVEKGELKFVDGRVRGQVSLPYDPEKSKVFKKSFELKFDLALGLDAPLPAAAPRPAGPVKPVVTGTFLGNKKPAKLAFVSAYPDEPFNDKPSIRLVFTEKDHTKDPKAAFNANFGKYGSALVILLHEDGGIFGCQVSHAEHKRQGFTSLGNIRTAAFDVGDDRVEGQIVTDGEVDTFGETWQVDIKFTAAYKPPVAKPVAAEPKKKAPDAPVADKPATKPAAKTAAKPSPASPTKPAKPADPVETVGSLNVYDLPLPKDATDVEYKKLVGQLTFKSPTAITALATEFAKRLDAQGWKQGDVPNVLNPASAIIARKLREGELTIMIQPDGKGSRVVIITEGLTWDEKPK